MMKRALITRAFTLAALVVAASASAADMARPFASPAAVDSITPPGVGSLGRMTFALALVLAAIFAAAWLMRRVRGFGKTGTGALDVIADLPLGQKERAVLVRVGNTQILLGVAPGRVSALHVLAEPVAITPASSESDPNSAQRPNFKSLLMKSLGKS